MLLFCDDRGIHLVSLVSLVSFVRLYLHFSCRLRFLDHDYMISGISIKSIIYITILSYQVFLSTLTWSSRTLTGTITPGQSSPGSNGNDGILHSLPDFQNCIITIGRSLLSYSVYPSIGGSYSSAKDTVSVFKASLTGLSTRKNAWNVAIFSILE